MADEREPIQPGTSYGDDPPGTPVGSDDGLTGNEVGRPPMPGETSGKPHAPDAEAAVEHPDQAGLDEPEDRGRPR